MQAKTKEVAALTSIIEAKTKHIGELGVSIVVMKEDLAGTQDALADDKKLLAELDESCAQRLPNGKSARRRRHRNWLHWMTQSRCSMTATP